MNDNLRKKLEGASLTPSDVLDLLVWQLSLPAADMDCDLISECDLFLDPASLGMDALRKAQMYDTLASYIRGQKTRRSAIRSPHRRRMTVCVVVRFQCSSASASFTSADVVTGAFAQIKSASRASINPNCSSGMAVPPLSTCCSLYRHTTRCSLKCQALYFLCSTHYNQFKHIAQEDRICASLG